MTALLEVFDLEKRFGGLTAVNRVGFKLDPGRIKAIIGPNGAGKTTLYNVITGIFPPDGGKVRFRNREITGWKPHLIAALGIARTFQIIKIFGAMTVLENVMVGCHLKSKTKILGAAFRLAPVWREEKRVREKASHFLNEVGLSGRAPDLARNLPLGQQRLLEIGRALASEPRLILLDEPASGLSGTEIRKLARLIYQIRDSGITVLLVEHDMSLVMDISDEVLVLDYGRKIAEGPPRAVQNDERVIAAYLGEEAS
jgi:branched-chain amino acid transport system ATP-binding protein